MTWKSQRTWNQEQAKTLRVITERRRSPRVRACIALLLTCGENKQEHHEQVFTLAISPFGCTLLSHRFFRPGARIQLKHNNKAITAGVVYCLPDRLTNLVEVGVEFDRDNQEFWKLTE